ncbi:MAG: hypothetical protein ACRYGK_08605 [Janthinobacterium lividum]
MDHAAASAPMHRTVGAGLVPAQVDNHQNGDAGVATTLPGAAAPQMLARSGGALLPGAPLLHLPGEVQNLVLRQLQVPDLLRLQGVSTASNACIRDHAQSAMTLAQTRQWNDLRQRTQRRQLAYSSQLFGTIWNDASCAPSAAQRQAARQMALRYRSLRLPLTLENRPFWKEMVECASAGDWQHLELDFTGNDEDRQLRHVRALMPCIAGLASSGRQVQLSFQFLQLDCQQTAALISLLGETPHVHTLALDLITSTARALNDLACAVGRSALQGFYCRCEGKPILGRSAIYRALAGKGLKTFGLKNIELFADQALATAHLLSSGETLTEFTADRFVLQNYTAQSFLLLVKALSSLKQLRKLDLVTTAGFDLASELVPLLQKTCTLEYLKCDRDHVAGNGFDAFAQALKQNTSLHWLELGNALSPFKMTCLPSQNSEALFQALQVNRSLRGLSLRHAEQSLASGLALAELLRRNDVLEQLEIDCHFFQNEDQKRPFFSLLLQGLEANTGLKRFTLRSYCHFIVKPLTKMMHQNRTLESLSLYGTIHSVDDMLELATALEGNFSLRAFNLVGSAPCELTDAAGNSTFDTGACGMSNAGVLALLTGKNGLQSVSLTHCDISDSAELAQALSANQQLSMLDLRYNPLDQDGLAALLQAVAGHSRLSVLLLDGVFIPFQTLKAFAQALQQRNLPLYLELDAHLFTDLSSDVLDRFNPQANWSFEQKIDIRCALLQAQADNPYLVIRGLGHAMAMQRDWDWRDFVND